jgi:hypothetical protein
MKLYKKHISTDYSQVNTSSQSDNVASRLFNEAEHRLQQQKWLEKKVKEARLSQYSFKPSINPLSQELAQAHDQRPIHERVGDLQREKNKRLQELRQSVDNEQIDLTFHPSIDNNSKRILTYSLTYLLTYLLTHKVREWLNNNVVMLLDNLIT